MNNSKHPYLKEKFCQYLFPLKVIKNHTIGKTQMIDEVLQDTYS